MNQHLLTKPSESKNPTALRDTFETLLTNLLRTAEYLRGRESTFVVWSEAGESSAWPWTRENEMRFDLVTLTRLQGH